MNGWPVAGWTSALLLALFAGLVATHGTDVDALGVLTRATARISFVVFMAVYVASPLRHFVKNAASAWLLRNRRPLGVSFAVAHGLHLVAIVWLASAAGEDFELLAVTLLAGGLAYLFIAAMAATSNDRAVAALGRRRWRLLHRAGIHYLWIIWAQNWTGAIATKPDALYAALALVVWGGAALRFAAWRGRR
jgi:hypothetical protein